MVKKKNQTDYFGGSGGKVVKNSEWRRVASVDFPARRGPGDRLFVDAPSEEGQPVDVQVGVPAETQVWEKYKKGTSRRWTYVLVLNPGDTPREPPAW